MIGREKISANQNAVVSVVVNGSPTPRVTGWRLGMVDGSRATVRL